MDTSSDLIVARPEGLFCAEGSFYVDPWRPVARAVITHAHANHARFGHARFLAANPGVGVLLSRLPGIDVQGLAYGEAIVVNGVRVSLHPAGHVLGSAQVRVEHKGRVWVASGDYKIEPDPTCAPFDPCAAIPLSRSRPSACRSIAGRTHARSSTASIPGGGTTLRRAARRCSSAIRSARHSAFSREWMPPLVRSSATVRSHRSIAPMRKRVSRCPKRGSSATSERKTTAFKGALIIAPTSAQGSTWMRRFGDYSDAFASGWMRLRGTRRRRGVDRGFVLSDHADWPGLQFAIGASGAERVIVTHGQIEPMVRWLSEQELDACAFKTEYGDDVIEADTAAPEAAAQ